MTKHPNCIPKNTIGILGWGHNFNDKIVLLDTKYQVTNTLGEGVIENTKLSFDQWATLQGTRQSLGEYAKYLTETSREALEGPLHTIIVTSSGNLSPSPGQYTILGGVLPRYSIIIDYLTGLDNFEHADGLNLGIYREKLNPDDTTLQSRVTLHRDQFRTIINCTKPGDTDALGVEYDTGDGWHPLGVGIGTNAKWEHTFTSPSVPVSLVYRVTLYRKGHALGLQTVESTSSQPK
jgi:hypothetical protein